MKSNKINEKVYFLNYLFLFGVFLYSYLLLTFYVEGDQSHYIKLYDALASATIFEVPWVAVKYVLAYEWVTFYILWLPAVLGVPKIIFISLSNVFLVFLLLKYLKSYNIKLILKILLIHSFYVLVLMTSAERLKFSYIFILLSVVSNSQTRRYFFALLACVTHFQTIILYAAFLAQFLPNLVLYTLKYKSIKKIYFSYALGLAVIAIVFYNVFGDGLSNKVVTYLNLRNILEFGKVWFVILVSMLIFGRNKVSVMFVFLTLGVVILFFGQDRVNMIVLTLFVHFCFTYQVKSSLPLYVLSFYMFIKSFPFLFNIFNYSNGFA